MNISFEKYEYFEGGRPIYRLRLNTLEVVLSTNQPNSASEAGVVAAIQTYLDGLHGQREDTKYTINGTTI